MSDTSRQRARQPLVWAGTRLAVKGKRKLSVRETGGIFKYLGFENKLCGISYTIKYSTFHIGMLLLHLHFCITAKLWLPLDL